jgi:hypothetical protein
VNEDSRATEHPVVFTNEIHDNPSFEEVATESIAGIVDFVADFKSNREKKYV